MAKVVTPYLLTSVGFLEQDEGNKWDLFLAEE
jgi:hypothetical protein